MAAQNKLLTLLATRPGVALSLDAICQLHAPGKPFTAKTPLRKAVINGLGELMQKGLVERAKNERTTFGGNAHVEYRVTAEGVKRHAAGGVTCVPKGGPRKSLPKPREGMRQRLWEALRISKKATLLNLAELIHQEGDPEPVKVIKDGLAYFAALARAGIVTKLAARAKGFAPTSNGHVRYAIIRDLGPIAPSAGALFVTDHNARARIDYKTEEH